jgi:hypothetical protein
VKKQVIGMHQFQDPTRGCCFLPSPQVAKQTAKGAHIVAPAGWDGKHVIRYNWSRDYLLVDESLAPA